jgi:hypothetical protein
MKSVIAVIGAGSIGQAIAYWYGELAAKSRPPLPSTVDQVRHPPVA